MGYAYGLLVRKTGSLWGAVLAHAAADVIFMYISFTGGWGLFAHTGSMCIHWASGPLVAECIVSGHPGRQRIQTGNGYRPPPNRYTHKGAGGEPHPFPV